MDEQEQWMDRFSNLWLSSEGEQEIIHAMEPVIENLGSVIDAEEPNNGIRVEKPQIGVSKDREEWLERFENQWPACEKDAARHSSEVLPEIEPGGRVNGDSKEFNPRPDDLIIFDIDPEIAIRLITASRGVGL